MYYIVYTSYHKTCHRNIKIIVLIKSEGITKLSMNILIPNPIMSSRLRILGQFNILPRVFYMLKSDIIYVNFFCYLPCMKHSMRLVHAV